MQNNVGAQMASFVDYYRTLGVHRHAEQAVIEAAYRALARRYHPDLNPGDQSANARLRRINDAYVELSDPAKRRAYDLMWDAHHAAASPPPKPPTSGTQQSTKTKSPQSPPPPPAASPRKSGRPWFVNVIGFVFVIVLLRAGAGMVGDPSAPTVSRPAQPTAPARTPTATAFAPALDFEQQGSIDLSAPSVPTPASTRWGFVESFGAASMWESQDTEWAESYVNANGLVVTIKAPGGFDGYIYDAMASGERDVAFGIVVDRIEGWGEINLILRGASGAPEWFFAVDPVAREWSLYRTSDTTSQFFYWVEPRPFGAITLGALRYMEVRVTDGIPALFINGVDVVRPTGIAMPDMPGSLVFGIGAGINPESLTGSGASFSVTFDRVELREL